MKIRRPKGLKIKKVSRKKILRGTVTLEELLVLLARQGSSGSTMREAAKELGLADPVIAHHGFKELVQREKVFRRFRPVKNGPIVQESVYFLSKYRQEVLSEQGQ